MRSQQAEALPLPPTAASLAGPMAAIAFLCCAQWNDELSIYALAKKKPACVQLPMT